MVLWSPNIVSIHWTFCLYMGDCDLWSLQWKLKKYGQIFALQHFLAPHVFLFASLSSSISAAASLPPSISHVRQICRSRSYFQYPSQLDVSSAFKQSSTWLHRYYLNWTKLDNAITKFNNEMHSADNWVLNPVILHWQNLPILILCSALLQFVLLKALYK